MAPAQRPARPRRASPGARPACPGGAEVEAACRARRVGGVRGERPPRPRAPADDREEARPASLAAPRRHLGRVQLALTVPFAASRITPWAARGPVTRLSRSAGEQGHHTPRLAVGRELLD